tara:strand:- start:847 stop:1011 length:165 start_codon:yes stop_codon:yes gene_type:complete
MAEEKKEMTMEELNVKLETVLDIVMEHFSESEDRTTALEEKVKRLEDALKKTSD